MKTRWLLRLLLTFPHHTFLIGKSYLMYHFILPQATYHCFSCLTSSVTLAISFPFPYFLIPGNHSFIFLRTCIDIIIPYLIFWDWLLSLSILSLRFNSVVEDINILFLFLLSSVTLCGCIRFFIHVKVYLRYLWFLENIIRLNIFMWI